MYEEEEEDDDTDSVSPPDEESQVRVEDLERLRRSASEELERLTGRALPEWTAQPVVAQQSRRHDLWGIDIPVGPLFYPCCGTDTGDAATLFGPYVSELHFADPFCAPHRMAGSVGRSELRRTKGQRGTSQILREIGNVVTGASGHFQFSVKGCQAYGHMKDGLLTLLEDLGELAVFFYRRDSEGEGGSDQRWLRPVLFDVLLSRMLDGGVIYTDGSNGGGAYTGLAPDDDHVTSLPVDANVGDEMTYRNRVLRCVYRGEATGWHHPEAAWQVKLRPRSGS